MKVSKLINELQKVIDTYGDADVLMDDNKTHAFDVYLNEEKMTVSLLSEIEFKINTKLSGARVEWNIMLYLLTTTKNYYKVV